MACMIVIRRFLIIVRHTYGAETFAQVRKFSSRLWAGLGFVKFGCDRSDCSLMAEAIPLAQMTSPRQSSSHQSSPRNSASLHDEERDTLLIHPPPTSSRTGAIWQIVAFTIVGLFIALGSAAFAYTLRGHVSKDFIHVPLPDLRDPSLLKYFGGMGPYIGLEYPPPPGQCRVSQVHMMARHGERYPTRHVGEAIASFASNISVGGFRDSLAFLNTWNLSDWIYAPELQLEQETLTGPAAGSTHMFTLGSQFRSRYGELWDFRSQGPVKVWSSDSTRVIHSAKYFASAFFGVNTPIQVEIIPETEQRSGNSLTTTYVPSSNK
jgi:hypothetical protein